MAERDLAFEREHKDLPAGTPRPNDGLNVRLKSLTPEEVAERKRKRRHADG